MAKSKKKSNKKTAVKKKKILTKKAALLIIAFVVILVATVLFFVFFQSKSVKLTDKTWYSQKAETASGDEANLSDIYSNYYSSYQGTLTFVDDTNFELWLTPGNPDDGTHKGTYKFIDNKITAEFSQGDTLEFTVEYAKDGSIEYIIVPYTDENGSYQVYFTDNLNK